MGKSCSKPIHFPASSGQGGEQAQCEAMGHLGPGQFGGVINSAAAWIPRQPGEGGPG